MKKWDTKSFYSLNYFLREKFGEKAFKISLDAGFSCPNRDGKVSTGGCIFCSSAGSGDFCGDAENLLEQFEQGKAMMAKKWKTGKYIGYFQAYTNTYDTVENLRIKYETIMKQEGVVALAIATRPDCLEEDVLDLLEELSKKTFLWVELGLQTIHESTAKTINRGYELKVYDQAVAQLRKRKIEVVTHVILGLPGETKEMMLNTVKYVAATKTQGIKLHLLHVIKDTKLLEEYEQGKVSMMKLDEYVDLIVDCVELLPENMVIHRITGDGPRATLVAPLWSLKKFEVINKIDSHFINRKTWQGKKYIGE